MMTNKDILYKESKKTGQKIFTVQDLSLLWDEPNQKRIWALIRHYRKEEVLKKIHKGIYELFDDWTEFEFAQKLLTPSYISFQTALAFHGLLFQYDSTIHSAALVSKRVNSTYGTYAYHKLKEEIFFQQLGLKKYDVGIKMASPERAICDTLYIHPGFVVERLDEVDFKLLKDISLLYGNKRLVSDVEKLLN